MRREGRGNNNKTANKQQTKIPPKTKNWLCFILPQGMVSLVWRILLKQARRFENLLWVKLGSMIWDCWNVEVYSQVNTLGSLRVTGYCHLVPEAISLVFTQFITLFWSTSCAVCWPSFSKAETIKQLKTTSLGFQNAFIREGKRTTFLLYPSGACSAGVTTVSA